MIWHWKAPNELSLCRGEKRPTRNKEQREKHLKVKRENVSLAGDPCKERSSRFRGMPGEKTSEKQTALCEEPSLFSAEIRSEERKEKAVHLALCMSGPARDKTKKRWGVFLASPCRVALGNFVAPMELPDTSAEIWRLTGRASGWLPVETGSGNFNMTRGKANLAVSEWRVALVAFDRSLLKQGDKSCLDRKWLRRGWKSHNFSEFCVSVIDVTKLPNYMADVCFCITGLISVLTSSCSWQADISLYIFKWCSPQCVFNWKPLCTSKVAWGSCCTDVLFSFVTWYARGIIRNVDCKLFLKSPSIYPLSLNSTFNLIGYSQSKILFNFEKESIFKGHVG